MKQFLSIIFVLGAAVANADPDPELGRELVVSICSACHGTDSAGDIGPDIRGKSRREIKYAVRGFDEMPEIDLTSEEIDALAAYLQSLHMD